MGKPEVAWGGLFSTMSAAKVGGGAVAVDRDGVGWGGHGRGVVDELAILAVVSCVFTSVSSRRVSLSIPGFLYLSLPSSKTLEQFEAFVWTFPTT